MRQLFSTRFLGAALVSGALALTACGTDVVADTKGLVGTYAVMITTGTRTDSDTLDLSAGSSGTLLLDFTEYGFSQIRGKPTDVGKFAIPEQSITVNTSTGGDTTGFISGTGTLTGDTLTVSLTLGDSELPDAGVIASFAITGTKSGGTSTTGDGGM